MRTALVSDVHGNAVALEAVLADLARNPVDQVVALGDMLQGGPQPVAVSDRLAELGWPVVLGNADAFLLDPDAGAEPATGRLLEVREWSVAQLGTERLDAIRRFAATVETGLGAGRKAGALEVAFRRVPFDPGDVVAATLAAGMPYADEAASRWRPR